MPKTSGESGAIFINLGTLVLMIAIGAVWGWTGAGIALGLWAILMGIGSHIATKRG